MWRKVEILEFTILKWNYYVYTVEEIQFIKELENITIKELKVKVILECEISKEGLKIEWHKGSKKIRRDDKFDIKVEGKIHRLIIEDVSAEDTGDYTASYQKLSTIGKLTVAIAPTILMDKLQDVMYMKVGSAGAIEVLFKASPMPDGEWKFKGGRLPDARRFKTDTVIGITSMTMTKVVRSDSGDYTVSLENEHGRADAKVKVIVTGENNCYVFVWQSEKCNQMLY